MRAVRQSHESCPRHRFDLGHRRGDRAAADSGRLHGRAAFRPLRRDRAEDGRGAERQLPQADLADEAATRALAASVLDRHGRLDVLVNNAGLSIRIPHTDLKAATPALWRQMLDVNLISPFILVAEAEAALRRAGGCVVNIGTHAGVRPKGSSIPYAASKAALHHVTKLLALALAPDVRVNAVAPGLVETPMTATWTDM